VKRLTPEKRDQVETLFLVARDAKDKAESLKGVGIYGNPEWMNQMRKFWNVQEQVTDLLGLSQARFDKLFNGQATFETYWDADGKPIKGVK
jgi:hypothetical protein